MISKKCDCCKKDRFRIMYTTIPILFKDGMKFFCFECGLSCISQYLKLNNKGIEWYLDFCLGEQQPK
jgi:hypothetical protein